MNPDLCSGSVGPLRRIHSLLRLPDADGREVGTAELARQNMATEEQRHVDNS